MNDSDDRLDETLYLTATQGYDYESEMFIGELLTQEDSH